MLLEIYDENYDNYLNDKQLELDIKEKRERNQPLKHDRKQKNENCGAKVEQ